MDRMLPQVDETLCTLCGLCAEACSCSAIELGERRPVFNCPEVSSCEPQEGTACDCLCEEVCPTGAITCSYQIVLGDARKARQAPDASRKRQNTAPGR